MSGRATNGPPSVHARHALLIIDMFNPLSFPGAERLAPNAVAIAGPIALMAWQVAQDGGQVFFINDDVARGSIELTAVRQAMIEWGGPSKAIARRMDPTLVSEIILKPQHSGFFETELGARLGALDVRNISIVGVAADLCVLATAVDACMRGLEVRVLSDLVASETKGRLDRALLLLKKSFNVQVMPWKGLTHTAG